MKQSKIVKNLQGLEDLRKSFGNEYVARVGIIGSKASEMHDGTALTNAQIGLIQFLGSITKKIPPRDFLVMPLQISKRDLGKAMSASAVKAAVKAQDVKKVFGLLGAFAEAIIQKAFETSGFGQWPANAPSTIAAKGSDRPLINTGQLRRSIGSEVVKKGSNKGAAGSISI